MNLSGAQSNYDYFTGKMSDVCRQLAFAGIALIWILGLGEDANATLPQPLIFPALVLVVCLGLDAAQYAVASASWGIFHRIKEQEDGVTAETEFTAPSWINWAGLVLFWGKIVALAIAYVNLGTYMAGRLA